MTYKKNKLLNLSLVVCSDFSYSDVLELFISFQEKFLPSISKKYLFTNFKLLNELPSYEVYYSYKNDQWLERLSLFIEKVPSKFILLLNDDVLIKNFNLDKEINKIISFMNSSKSNYCQLDRNPRLKIKKLNVYPNFYRLYSKMLYGKSLQSAIWNKQELTRILKENRTKTSYQVEDMWLLESLKTKSKYFSNYYYYHNNFFFHSVFKGKWFNRTKMLVKKNNINYIFNKNRVFLKHSFEIYLFSKHFIRRLISPRLRFFLKYYLSKILPFSSKV
jgi:Fe-S cluster biosynthesis and repair protein YggX